MEARNKKMIFTLWRRKKVTSARASRLKRHHNIHTKHYFMMGRKAGPTWYFHIRVEQASRTKHKPAI